MTSAPIDSPGPSADAIRQWLVGRLAELLRASPDEIHADEPFAGMALDSMQFVALVGELEDRFGCRFQDNPLFEYPTIDALSEYLAGELAEERTAIQLTARRKDD